VGYKKHTLRLWLPHYQPAVMLVPLMSWAAPANRSDTLFLQPSLRHCSRAFQWLPEWVLADMAYINLAAQRRIREQLKVAVITKLRADMHLVEPYTANAQPRCPQGQALQWLSYDAPSEQQWFGVAPHEALCRWCWQQAHCPREFSYPAASHEILLGLLPHASRLAKHLREKVRPWIEPAQSYEKNQLGLSSSFLNSLQLTWVMCLLADTVVLLRAQAQLCAPPAPLPLGELTPQQLAFSWH
jgi:hypothetical protein